ncbi:MAG: hypothetical protein RL463_883 [Bacteroidota bacterium]|jgi:Mg/Co/Ni transporter MgtE
MAFWDDLGNSLTGESSNEIINKQMSLQAQALDSKQKATISTGLIIGVILAILIVLGVVIYLIQTSKTSA